MPDTTFDRNRVATGDKVGVNDPKYPGTWIVERFLPKNILIRPEAGGRGLRCPRWMLTAPPEVSTVNGRTIARIGLPYVPIPPLGALVVCSIPKVTGYYVVCGSQNGKVRIAMLGGDGDRYWRVAPSTLTVIDPDTVIATTPGAPAPPAEQGLRLVPPVQPTPPPPASAGKHSQCERCGYQFPKPQAKSTCNSTAACMRRASKRATS